MIPSRPLSFMEILTETFSIFGRTFARNALLFVLLVVPGVVLVTIGLTDFAEDAIVAARHDIHLNDTTLTALRTEFNGWNAKNNPLAPPLEPSATHVDSVGNAMDSVAAQRSADVTTVEHYFATQLGNFSSPLSILILGSVLLLVGSFAFSSSCIDLACQVFEERGQELGSTLRSAFFWNVWKLLGLYFAYTISVAIVDRLFGAVGTLSPGVGDALAGIIMLAKIYVALRCSLTVPALVSEELRSFAALRRSWELTRLTSSRVLVFSIMFALIGFFLTMFVSLVTSIPFGGVFTWMHEFNTTRVLSVAWLLDTLPGFISGLATEMTISALILFPLLPIFFSVFYYDLRTRRDGPLVYLPEGT